MGEEQSTKRIAIVVVDGSEDVEIFIPLDIFTRAGYQVTLISAESSKTIVTKSGVPIITHAMLVSVDLNHFDAVYIPGGQIERSFHGFDGGIYARKAIESFAQELQKRVGDPEFTLLALCAAPGVLAKWGIFDNIEDLKITCYPGVEANIILKYGENVTISKDNGGNNKPVAISKNVITGNGPAAAIPMSMMALHYWGKDAAPIASEMMFAGAPVQKA